MKSFLVSCVLSLLVQLSVCAQVTAKTSRIRIYATPTQLQAILSAGVDIDHGYYDHETSTYINTFDWNEVLQIKALGYKVDILVEDVVAYVDSINLADASEAPVMTMPKKSTPQLQALTLNFSEPCQPHANSVVTPPSFVLGSMGGFYNLAELDAQINDMVAKHPGLVSKSSIGNTLQGRPIWVVKISDNVATDEPEPEVLYTGMHHSREGMSMMNLIFFMRYLLDNYNSNKAIKELVDSRELFFIPVVNVDGFNYNTTATNWNAGKRFRRKNMAETTTSKENANGSGGDGVDINRNYGTYWGSGFATTSTTQTGSSGTGSSDAFRGSAAFSEPETQRMRDFVNARNFKVALNYHCYGNWWIRPQGPDDATHPSTALSAANVNIYNSVANLFTRHNCYVYGTPKQTVYPVNGYSDDFMFSGTTKAPIFAFSPEVGDAADDFWCPTNKIVPYSKEVVFSNLQAAYSAGSYAELQDHSDVSIQTLNGAFNFSVVRKGLTDAPITITLVPISGIQTVGAAVTINSIAGFGGIVNGSINYTLPANTAAGDVVTYAWRLETAGISITDTITKFFRPIVVFTDNMDVSSAFATNWVLAGTSPAWAYASGTGIGGSASLTESPAGNYTNSADQSVRLANSFNLSGATHAYMSFMIRHQSENCQDRVQVEVSTTGVNGTYMPICTQTTVRESRGSLAGNPALTGTTDGWVRELVDLKNYIGNNNMSLRFRFLSNGSTRAAYITDGFNIDNIQIVKTEAALLPVRFEDLTAVRKGDEVRLAWKAQVEGAFRHFVIERSSNGQEFESIGTVSNPVQAYFIDNHPNRGPNYYRVKAIDQDGSEKISKSVMIYFEPVQVISGYPNPVRDQFTIELFSMDQTTGVVALYTLDGKELLQEQWLLRKGMNKHVLQTGALLPGIYVVQVRDSQGKVSQHYKLVKQ